MCVCVFVCFIYIKSDLDIFAIRYYMNGRQAKAADFVNPEILDLFPQQAARVKAVIKEVGLEYKPLMLGETGSCWGGGAPHLSNRYAGGFL